MNTYHLYLAGSRTGVVKAQSLEAAAASYGLSISGQHRHGAFALANRYGAPAGTIALVA